MITQKGRHQVRTPVDSLFDVSIHSQSCSGVEIASQRECSLHGLAVSQVCQNAQLQLSIVSNHKSVPL